MKSTAYLQDESILTLLALNNLIVPEIQRDYVWGENEDVLRKFISDIKKYAKKCDACKRVHSEKNNNIGFLYSYKPPYQELEQGRYLDEFLIDGQQRITTVFLLLLSRAVAENRIRDFKNICRVNDDGFAECFNYKVRAISQSFMDNLLKYVIKIGDTTSLDFIYEGDRPSWFLSDFKQDPTATAICKSLKIINDSFKDDDHLYFDFLLENIHFWHFKTEITTQGEELYISMNSTGEQLSDNEKKKADIMSKEDTANFGNKWEEWQNLFWWKRCVGISKPTGEENADKGFNNYLLCIEDLERKFEQGIPQSDTFQIYMDALCLVTNTSCEKKSSEREDLLTNKLNELKLPTEWLLDFREKIWNILNTQAWSIGEKITDAAFQKTMLFWPWMYFCKSIKNKSQRTYSFSLKDVLNNHLEDLLRILHLFYIRYYCDKRDYRKIKIAIDEIMEKNSYKKALNDIGEVSIDNTEKVSYDELEKDKSPFYIEEKELQELYDRDNKLESIIWNIQNIPVIRDGSNCGGNTVMRIKDMLKNCNSATQVLNFLIKVFDQSKKEPSLDQSLLRSLLLLYSSTSPNGQDDVFWHGTDGIRYFTEEWKRTVRSNAFWNFYEENKAEDTLDLLKLLESKRNSFFSNNNIIDYNSPMPRYKKAIIYDALCSLQKSGDSIWTNNNVGFGTNSNVTSLFNDKDVLYRISKKRVENTLYNLPDRWQEILRNKYSSLVFSNYPVVS